MPGYRCINMGKKFLSAYVYTNFLVEDKENVMKILHSADINGEFNILRKQIFLS